MYKVNKSLKRYKSSNKSVISTNNRANSKSVLRLSSNSTEKQPSTKYMNRECILFPTYAFRNPQDLNGWIIRTKGWALTLKKPGPKQKLLKGITKSLAGKRSNENETSNRMFENRFKYFLAKGKRNKEFIIKVIDTEQNQPKLVEDILPPWIETMSRDNFPATPTNNNDLDRNPSYIFGTKNSFHPLFHKKIDSYSKPSHVLERYDDMITDTDDDDDDYSGSSSNSSSSSSSNNSSSNNSSSSNRAINDSRRPFVNESSVVLKSDGAGMILGEFCVSNQQIQSLMRQGCERMIKIGSTSKRNPYKRRNLYFPPGSGQVQIISPYGVSVISDIDDTIKDTMVLSGARKVLSNTFFNPTRAVPGMADVYLEWYNYGASFHYVSNSPFQLVHMLYGFIENHHFPPGSFHLRHNAGLLSKLVDTAGSSKQDSISRIMRDFPHRKFILVGDSAEIDLEIYTRIATEFPDQILKIFIRDLASNHHEKHSHISNKKSTSTLPSFFSNQITNKLHSGYYKSFSCPNLDTIPKENSTSDDDKQKEDDNEINDTASKLVEMVLEPSLTGHSSVIRDLSSEEVPALTTPVGPRVAQLHNRICHAKKLLKDIDIILFTDARKLQNDNQVRQALRNLSLSNSQ